ncbi:MAG: hypothetical protein U1F20_01895 [Lysobacterales bacterium]
MSEDDFKGLFDDLDVNSAKLGPTVAKRNIRVKPLTPSAISISAPIPTIRSTSSAMSRIPDDDVCVVCGKIRGEFFTPQEVSELLARITVVGKTEVNKV